MYFDGPKAYIITFSNGEKITKSKGTEKNVLKLLKASDYALVL